MLDFDRRYVLLPMLLGIAVVIAGFLVTEADRDKRIESVNAIHRSQERNRFLAEVQLSVSDAESAQRGFMLTGDDEYLQPYRESKAKVENLLTELRATYDNSEAHMAAKASELAALVQTKFAEIDSTLVVYDRNRSSGLALAKTTFGQRSMDSVRTVTSEMRTQEREFVRTQTADWLRAQQINRAITAGGAALNILLILLAGALVTRDLRRRAAVAADLESQITKATKELSELSTHLQQLSERERSSLARELHDELGGLLIAIKMDLAQLKSQIDLTKDDVRTRWERIQSTLSAGIDLKRRVIEQLRPSLLDNMGLVAAIKWQSEQVCSGAKLELVGRFPEEEPKISSDAAIALFRIAQEALTNIVKHAQATRVDLSLAIEDGQLILLIEDDGIGITAARPAVGSHGIAGMKHRLKSFGGDFKLERRWPNGTRLTASVSLQRVAAAA